MDPFKLPEDQAPAPLSTVLPPAPAPIQAALDAAAGGLPPAAPAPAPIPQPTTTRAAAVAKPKTEDPNWERGVLEKIALAGIAEQKSARRWGIFFKFATFTYLTVLLLMVIGFTSGSRGKLDVTSDKHTALVSIQGGIMADGANSAERINAALNAAFEDKGTAGVILKINSPGGSPVQSGMVFDEIKRLRKKYDAIPVHIVIEDMCASGGYYIAAAGDKIYVDKASIVGSIGVIMQGFGFTGTMEKLGVEGRTITSGENKAFLDPFSPVNDAHKAHAKALLGEVHEQFKKVVRDGRGKRLKETPEMFSGLFWTGAKAIELGLADEFGTVDSVAKNVIKAETIVDYSERENVAERLAKRFGASVGTALADRITPQVGAVR